MIVTRAIVLVVCALAIAACSPARSQENVFSLRALPLETDNYYLGRTISSESGTLSGLCSPTAVFDEQVVLCKYSIEDKALRLVFSTPMPQEPKGQPRPQLVLADNRVFLKDWVNLDAASSDFRSHIRYSLLDTETGTSQDVTPTNIVETTQWMCKAGPLCLWSDLHGVILFTPNKETREVHLWQGKETLREVQRIPSVLGVGQTFAGGRFTAVIVTEKGDALVYNHDTGRIEDSPRHQAVAAQMVEIVKKPKRWPLYFVMAEEVAAFKWDSGKVYALVAADGSRQDLQMHHALDERPDGTKRSDDESDILVIDSSPLRSEGKHLPSHVVNAGSVLVPVDEKRVGIFDVFYQRLIVIGPPGERSD